jgi:hypothetical protein
MIDNPSGLIVMPASAAALFEEWERKGSIRRVQPSSVGAKEVVAQPLSGPLHFGTIGFPIRCFFKGDVDTSHLPHHVVTMKGMKDGSEQGNVLPDQGEPTST